MAKSKDKGIKSEFDGLIIEPASKAIDATKIPLVVEGPLDYTHPDWTNFVLEHLTDDEMWDGYPRVDGLRRLVEKFFGRITGTYVKVDYHANPFPTVIVKATIQLESGETHEASSDATIYSAQGEFRNKLTAIADSRAKSKAYREILRLRNVSSREEAVPSDDVTEDEDIQLTQKNMITVIYPRNIPVKYDTGKLINFVLGSEKRLEEQIGRAHV